MPHDLRKLNREVESFERWLKKYYALAEEVRQTFAAGQIDRARELGVDAEKWRAGIIALGRGCEMMSCERFNSQNLRLTRSRVC